MVLARSSTGSSATAGSTTSKTCTCPVSSRSSLEPGEDVSFASSAGPDALRPDGTTYEDERRRQQALLDRAGGLARDPVTLPEPGGLRGSRSSSPPTQFLVRGGGRHSVIAGYHWFEDWGRDAMIALPGLTLATGRLDEAREILLSFAEVVSEGMLPNRFPDDGGSAGVHERGLGAVVRARARPVSRARVGPRAARPGVPRRPGDRGAVPVRHAPRHPRRSLRRPAHLGGGRARADLDGRPRGRARDHPAHGQGGRPERPLARAPVPRGALVGDARPGRKRVHERCGRGPPRVPGRRSSTRRAGTCTTSSRRTGPPTRRSARTSCSRSRCPHALVDGPAARVVLEHDRVAAADAVRPALARPRRSGLPRPVPGRGRVPGRGVPRGHGLAVVARPVRHRARAHDRRPGGGAPPHRAVPGAPAGGGTRHRERDLRREIPRTARSGASPRRGAWPRCWRRGSSEADTNERAAVGALRRRCARTSTARSTSSWIACSPANGGPSRPTTCSSSSASSRGASSPTSRSRPGRDPGTPRWRTR